MRCYRAAWVAPGWERRGQREPGHPLFVTRSRQGAGRFDNPSHYAALYASRQPDGAVGEVLGNHATVRAGLFVWAGREELARHLVTLEVDDAPLLDLDDPGVLRELGLRPSDVVRRDRELTRRIALRRYLTREQTGEIGLSWWSYHRPDWTQLMLWSREAGDWFPHVRVVDAEPLDLDHPEVVVAADALRRPVVG